MSFKINPPYKIDNTPIYFVPEEPGVLGRANMCGTITINSNIRNKKQEEEVISHEKVHIDQIKDGRLAYDDCNIYHRKSGKGKWSVVKRGKNDGSRNYWWEKEAYKKEKNK
jgi:hypothetical protein|tara:strand:+ start:1133 stop:1465 length:333 start_codon:yes stop_codon:yes gene_type:complete